MTTRFLLVLFLLAPAANAQFHNVAPPSISTSGSAEIKVVPDRIEIAVGVEHVDPVLAKAKADNDAAVAKVIAAAKQRGIDPGKIQTDFIGIEPEERSDRVLQYRVRRSVVIESSDVPGFEALLSTLLDAGVNHVHSISFRTSQLRAHRDEARRMAAKAAQEKATLLAESLGRKVGRVRGISESTDYWGSSYGSWWGRWGGGGFQNVAQNSVSTASLADGALAPGRISVTASVHVTFDLE